MYHLFIILLSLSNLLVLADEVCQSRDECDSQSTNDLYNSYDNEIIRQIELAEAQEHKPCDQTKCLCHSSVIANDLKPFKDGITQAMIAEVADRGTKYQIIDHRLYRNRSCMFPARCSGVEYFIRQNLKNLPNMEMIINVRDWPQVLANWGPHAPVFSFSKTSEYKDIMYPTWAFWEGGPAISLYPRGIGRWDQHRVSINESSERWPWPDKKPLGFFRGSRTSSERDSLILLSRKFPNLVDASYTKNQAWKSPADTLNAEPAQEISPEDHCQYKYLFNFRGVAASFRLKHLFLCKSLVFHVGDKWQEFFYPSLRKWVHYVPVVDEPTQEDIQRLLNFFEKHDDLGQKIARQGFEHIWNNLRMQDVSCYWRRLLRRYAKLLTYEVSRDPSLIEL